MALLKLCLCITIGCNLLILSFLVVVVIGYFFNTFKILVATLATSNFKLKLDD